MFAKLITAWKALSARIDGAFADPPCADCDLERKLHVARGLEGDPANVRCEHCAWARANQLVG